MGGACCADAEPADPSRITANASRLVARAIWLVFAPGPPRTSELRYGSFAPLVVVEAGAGDRVELDKDRVDVGVRHVEDV